MSESDADFEMLEKRLEALTPDERILVASAFSQLPAKADQGGLALIRICIS